MSSTTVALMPAQRQTLSQALADAISYRDPPLHCPGCTTTSALCDPCQATLTQARAYLQLSHDLGIIPGTPPPAVPQAGAP
jgi:hypothetical protein